MSSPASERALAPTRSRKKASVQSKNAKWSSEEDEKLRTLMGQSPQPTWPELAQCLQGKTAQQISERWEKVLNPALVKGSWTADEDRKIIEFVKQNGVKNWTKLASLLPGRIGKQCRERWRNHLDPDVSAEPFSNAEDEILISLHNKLGNSWVKIAEHLPGRSDNSVKNRWNSTLKKLIEYGKNGGARPRRGRPSLSSAQKIFSHAVKSADDVPKPPKFDDLPLTIKAASPAVIPTQGISSPFQGLKSPFTALSPNFLNQTPTLVTFPTWSPSGDTDGLPMFSPHLFSPSISENRSDTVNLLSPLFNK